MQKESSSGANLTAEVRAWDTLQKVSWGSPELTPSPALPSQQQLTGAGGHPSSHCCSLPITTPPHHQHCQEAPCTGFGNTGKSGEGTMQESGTVGSPREGRIQARPTQVPSPSLCYPIHHTCQLLMPHTIDGIDFACCLPPSEDFQLLQGFLSLLFMSPGTRTVMGTSRNRPWAWTCQGRHGCHMAQEEPGFCSAKGTPTACRLYPIYFPPMSLM